MTLHELVEEVAQRDGFSTNRLRNTRTAVRYLAQALGKSDPSLVHETDLQGPLDDLIEALNRELQGSDKSGQTIKNYRNFIRHFVRKARELELIQTSPPAERVKTVKEARRDIRAHNRDFNLNGDPYLLKLEDWPMALRQWWQTTLIDAQTQLKPYTLDNYRRAIERYVGYLNETDDLPETPEDLYEFRRLKGFNAWVASRRGTRGLTTTAEHLLAALKLPDDIEADRVANVDAMRRKYRPAEAMHDKNAYVRNLNLDDLDRVGRALQQRAQLTPSNGSLIVAASWYRDGLILRMLRYIPLRSRNVREMQLYRNLHQDAQGVWRVRFRGDELKVAMRGNRTNEFYVKWPDPLVEDLEEYLDVWRPRLVRGHDINLVFPSNGGCDEDATPRIMTPQVLSRSLKHKVWIHTEKYFTPHLVRTLFGTEMARRGVPVNRVAYLLNDEIATVYRRYYEEVEADIEEKVYAEIDAPDA